MNLAVDIGNSSMKIALYDQGSLQLSFKDNDIHDIFQRLLPFKGKIDRALISSTRSNCTPLEHHLSTLTDDVALLTHEMKMPFIISYETPETLGTDRIAAVAGAYARFPGDDVLIIDAGTAITYEYLEGSRYRGGNISPGIGLRFRSLHEFTEKLPLLSATENYSSPGKNSSDAIIAGVINGALYEINEYIRTFLKLHSGGKVILTGGDGLFIHDKIDMSVALMPDIVTDGLNFLMEYNAK